MFTYIIMNLLKQCPKKFTNTRAKFNTTSLLRKIFQRNCTTFRLLSNKPDTPLQCQHFRLRRFLFLTRLAEFIFNTQSRHCQNVDHRRLRYLLNSSSSKPYLQNLLYLLLVTNILILQKLVSSLISYFYKQPWHLHSKEL